MLVSIKKSLTDMGWFGSLDCKEDQSMSLDLQKELVRLENKAERQRGALNGTLAMIKALKEIGYGTTKTDESKAESTGVSARRKDS